jgi:hypothetical protein
MALTVKQLIVKLQSIEDDSKYVYFFYDSAPRGEVDDLMELKGDIILYDNFEIPPLAETK